LQEFRTGLPCPDGAARVLLHSFISDRPGGEGRTTRGRVAEPIGVDAAPASTAAGTLDFAFQAAELRALADDTTIVIFRDDFDRANE
jgi:hypothetical protein